MNREDWKEEQERVTEEEDTTTPEDHEGLVDEVGSASENNLEMVDEQGITTEVNQEMVGKQKSTSEELQIITSETPEKLVISQSRVNEKEKSNGKVKSFMSMVAAGVVGSLLTLAAVYFIDLGVGFNDDSTEWIPTTEVAATNSGIVTQQTSYPSNNIIDVIEDASKAVVGIINLREHPNFQGAFSGAIQGGTGSGVVFQKDDNGAFIVTNHHVIEGASEIEVSLYNGENVRAEVIGSDALTDIAVLRIETDLELATMDFGDSKALRPGEQVLAIGNPLGLELSRTVTQGIVSAIERTIPVTTSAGEWDIEVIQTDAAINPGNSGGALINIFGEMVGINTLKVINNGAEGLGFAIPSSEFQPIITEILEKGFVERPYMGVGLANFDEIPPFYFERYAEDVEQGVVITNVAPDSPAAQAGLEVEDIITALNGVEVASSRELRNYLYSQAEPGDEILVTIYRKGETLKLPLMLSGTN